ncbi:TetR/AcrR family transcriptional regulator [Azotobacter vinelandii]
MLEQAMQMFWRHGYEATSLQDLLTATGLSKSSLYQTYPSKRALFAAALRHYCAQRRRELRERLQAAVSPREFLRGWLCCALEEECAGEAPRGCMLVNVASEFFPGRRGDRRLAAQRGRGAAPGAGRGPAARPGLRRAGCGGRCASAGRLSAVRDERPAHPAQGGSLGRGPARDDRGGPGVSAVTIRLFFLDR